MNKGELISRELVLKETEAIIRFREQHHLDTKEQEAFLQYIKERPAVDAVEVVHASWIERFSFGCWHYYCSNCEDGYTMSQRQTHKSNYCPNCGADMRERKE